MKRIAALIVIILIVMTAGTAFSEDKVKIGYLRIVMSLPTFVAAEKGLFEEAGLKVELTPFESGTEDVMHTGAEIPRVAPATPMREVLFEMTRKRLGLTTVADADGLLRGIISDGDLRRQMERHGYQLLDRTAAECMTADPVSIGRRELATRALDEMERRKITALLVTDAAGRIEGVVHLHDLWQTEMI